jgi:nicotinamide riboside kinase
MKIGFLGVHNGGKDTLSHYLFNRLKLRGKTVYYIPEQAEQALIRGMKLNTEETQMWLLGTQIAKEMEAQAWNKREFIICNRTVVDVPVYSMMLDNVMEIQSMVEDYLQAHPYDVLFRVHPFDTIEDDGVRDTDRDYQDAIHQRFDLELLNNRLSCIDLDQPTKEKRMEAIDMWLSNHLNKVDDHKKI